MLSNDIDYSAMAYLCVLVFSKALLSREIYEQFMYSFYPKVTE